MQSLKNFEWYRDAAGYRLAWLPQRGKKAHWINRPDRAWSEDQEIDRSVKLDISTTQYHGEKRVAKAGIYIAGHRQTLNARKPDETAVLEVVRPFATNELVSRNFLQMAHTPKGWLHFTNRYGMIGHHPLLDHWYMSGKDDRWFIYQVEHEGELHHLTNVLSRIYEYYPAIKQRDSSYLSNVIKWESDDVVREDRGVRIQRTRIQPSIAMRGKYSQNADYFEYMRRPDVFTPAALVLKDHINRYFEKSLSLEVSFDPKSLEFTSSLRYGSFGAALVAEAVEFMAGHFTARQCNVCGSWFRMGTDQMRKDRIFCSAACKMRDYRARKSKSGAKGRSAGGG
jgi:hypothetical protein